MIVAVARKLARFGAMSKPGSFRRAPFWCRRRRPSRLTEHRLFGHTQFRRSLRVAAGLASRSMARAMVASAYIRQLRSGLPLCCMHGLIAQEGWDSSRGRQKGLTHLRSGFSVTHLTCPSGFVLWHRAGCRSIVVRVRNRADCCRRCRKRVLTCVEQLTAVEAPTKRSEVASLCYVVSWRSDQQRQPSSSSAPTMAGPCESALTAWACS
jgi:hypothetical protein